jgi:CRISPR/Cas system-associated exonuclease Cas4 (RecB family)
MTHSILTQPQKRSKPYTWVTTVAQLMASQEACPFLAWLRTQYQISLPPSEFDTSVHDDMVNDRTQQLRKQGYLVTVENANSLKLTGNTFDICIAGRPDIIAIKDNTIIVEDCKSGRQHLSHDYQILLYMLLMRYADKTKEKCKNRILLGRLVYLDIEKEIPESEVNKDLIVSLHQVLDQLTSQKIPTPKASQWNCRFCQISDNYCSINRCD